MRPGELLSKGRLTHLLVSDGVGDLVLFGLINPFSSMKLPVSRLPRVAQRFVLPALLLAGASAQADLNFTVVGFSTSGGHYDFSELYTFTFIVNGDFTVGAGNNFTTNLNYWKQQLPTDDVLVTSFSGSRLAGIMAGTSASEIYFANNLTGPGSDFLGLAVGVTSGLSVNGDTVTAAVLEIYGAGNISDVFTNSYVSPESVFTAMTTAPLAPMPPSSLSISTELAGLSRFELVSFTIENTSTEVPFGVDSSVGLAALGLAGAWKLRRRRKQAAVTAAN